MKTQVLLFLFLVFTSFMFAPTVVALVSADKSNQELDFQINIMAASQPSMIQPNDPGSGGGGGGVIKE